MFTIQRVTPWDLASVWCWPMTWMTAPGCAVLTSSKDNFATKVRMFDMISTSERLNDRGDRNCTHSKVSGSISQMPEQVLVEKTPHPIYGDDHLMVRLMVGDFAWKTISHASGVGPLSFEDGGTIKMMGGGTAAGRVGHLTLSSVATMPGDKFAVKFSLDGKEPSFYEGEGTTVSQWYGQELSMRATCKSQGAPWYGAPVQFAMTVPFFRYYGGKANRYESGNATFADTLVLTVTVLRTMLEFLQSIAALRENRDAMFSELLLEALRNIRQSSFNGIAYLRDLKEMASGPIAVFKALKELAHGRVDARHWRNARRSFVKSLAGFERYRGMENAASSAYLNYRYGLRLFIHDTRAIFKVLDQLEESASRFDATINRNLWGSLGPVPSTNHIEVFVNDTNNSTIALARKAKKANILSEEGFKDWFRLIRRFDLLPSRANIWDLIPYSFVVDWFIPVGTFLERLDAEYDIEAYNVKECVWSQKFTNEFSLELLGYYGSLKHVFYVRTCWDEKNIRKHLSAADLKLGEGISLRNLFSGLALILQRR